MFLEFINTKIGNKRKLLSLSNLLLLFYQPLPICGKNVPSLHFMENKHNFNHHLLCNKWERPSYDYEI